jgi:hypothetical protein
MILPQSLAAQLRGASQLVLSAQRNKMISGVADNGTRIVSHITQDL